MIWIVGCGPGQHELLTLKAKELIEAADLVVGFDRLVTSIKVDREVINIGRSLSKLLEVVKKNSAKEIVVLASGDPKIYGVEHYLRRNLELEINVVSGISSVQYLFSKIHENMNDLYLTSAHGKTLNYDLMLLHDKCVVLTDSVVGPYEIAAEYRKKNLDPTLYIGECLSYKNEKIEKLKASQVKDRVYGMNVVVILNER